MPHDLDTVFNLGNSTASTNLSIFTYDGLAGLNRFFDNEEIVQRYYAKILELLDGPFRPSVIHPAIDELLGDFVSQDEIDDARDWTTGRIRGVLAQIPQDFSVATDLAVSDGFALPPARWSSAGTSRPGGAFRFGSMDARRHATSGREAGNSRSRPPITSSNPASIV